MNLNDVEYYYIRNAQGDITGLFDGSGTQVVTYTYDSWGKIISTTGTLASTVGAKNPYRYRGYRYDSETGLYYLQSRYYSPEWGRFINADGLVGQRGELLAHNLFTYCKNNPVNKYDPAGFMALDCDGEGRTAPIRKPVAPSKPSGSGFNTGKSAVKGTISSSVDKMGETVAGIAIKGHPVYEEFGCGLGAYSYSLSGGAKFSKGALGVVGTAGFTSWDAAHSIYNGEYVGAGIDVGSGAAGLGAGYGLGILGGIAIAAGAPEILVGVAVFATAVGVGMFIDWGAGKIKDSYYGR